MLTNFVPKLVTSFFVFGTTLGGALANELPMRAVVNGHDVQPTERQLLAIGHPDLTAPEAEEVNNLYKQLTQNSHANRQGRTDDP